MPYIDKVNIGGVEYDIQDSNLKSAFGVINWTNGLQSVRKPYVINSAGKWEGASAMHLPIYVKGGDILSVTSGETTTYSLLKSDNANDNVPADFCNGITSRNVLNANRTVTFTVPSDCNVVVFAARPNNGDTNQIPESILLNGVEQTYNLRKKIDEIENNETGNTAGIQANKAEIQANKAILHDIVSVDNSQNLFDRSNPDNLDGYSISGSTGQIIHTASSADFTLSYYVPVIGCDFLSYVSSADLRYSAYAFYDEDYNYITDSASGITRSIAYVDGMVVPDNAYYFRFSFRTSAQNVTLVNGQAHPTTHIEYQGINYKAKTSTGCVLEVSQDGSKPFTTINAAYAFAYRIQSKQNPVTILIYPGIYNEVLECTSANGSPYVWGAYVSFIGVNQKDVIWRNDSGLYINSPLHTSNPCLIKNITFIATHDDDSTFETKYADYTADNQQNYGAYGLHLDDPSNRTDLTGEEYETIVEDCTIISKQHAAIGAGLRAGQTLIIRNCRLLMEIPSALKNAVDSTKGALLFHRILGTDDTFIQNLIVDTCNIETNMDKAIFTYGSGGGFKADFIRNLIWSETGGAENDVIRGPVGMITTKSYGNNVAALNKTTI